MEGVPEGFIGVEVKNEEDGEKCIKTAQLVTLIEEITSLVNMDEREKLAVGSLLDVLTWTPVSTLLTLCEKIDHTIGGTNFTWMIRRIVDDINNSGGAYGQPMNWN